jgi:hypothetical protein
MKRAATLPLVAPSGAQGQAQDAGGGEGKGAPRTLRKWACLLVLVLCKVTWRDRSPVRAP